MPDVRFEGDLVLHSHLGMSGMWGVYGNGNGWRRSRSRAWIVFRCGDCEVAGIGNIWKAEGCWEAGLDPWRALESLLDHEAVAVIEAVRPRMVRSAMEGPRAIQPRVYGRAGRPCPRCGSRVSARGQGDANRTTYWCSGCQK